MVPLSQEEQEQKEQQEQPPPRSNRKMLTTSRKLKLVFDTEDQVLLCFYCLIAMLRCLVLIEWQTEGTNIKEQCRCLNKLLLDIHKMICKMKFVIIYIFFLIFFSEEIHT